ncbi:MAG: hypothetical protein M1355_02445, partial [Patescibacteria group bacterium]|nr:hypothetical protein [Patescibacteria group bacterium]
NCNNVDLNRNFNTKDWISHGIWEFGDQKITISGGKNPLSEPETRALVNFIDKNNIKIVFDFHNRVGTVLATGDKLGKEIAKIYCKSSGYKDITGTEWQNTGWIKNYLEEKDITYVEIETLKRWGSDWERNKEALIKSLEYIKTI